MDTTYHKNKGQSTILQIEKMKMLTSDIKNLRKFNLMIANGSIYPSDPKNESPEII